MVTFEESGMTFSFDENDIFYIEKSERFNKIEGAKPCECVVQHNGKVCLIEAKISSPQLARFCYLQKISHRSSRTVTPTIVPFTRNASNLTLYHRVCNQYP